MYPLELVGLVMSSVTTAPQGRQRKNEVKRYHMAGTWRGPTTYCLQLRSRTWRLLKMRPRWDPRSLLTMYFNSSHILPVIRVQLYRMPGKWVCMLPETSSPTIENLTWQISLIHTDSNFSTASHILSTCYNLCQYSASVNVFSFWFKSSRSVTDASKLPFSQARTAFPFARLKSKEWSIWTRSQNWRI